MEQAMRDKKTCRPIKAYKNRLNKPTVGAER